MLIAWAVFPALLTAAAMGWAAALAGASGLRLSPALMPALGYAAIVVVGEFLTLADATAELVTPLVAAVGALGLAMLARSRPRRPSRWGLVAVGGVFCVYAAPIVLSGEATFAGFIRLDDTATWMALTDRVLDHGRSLDGLGPSSYEATLAFNLGDGYPVGVFIPLGAGARLLGQDVAWVIQPYMAWLAAALAAALWSLTRPLALSGGLRAGIAFVAAQSALLVGYYLWGGVKEVAAAALIATLAALVPLIAERRFPLRAVAPMALLAAGLVGVLSAGGLIWIVPALALLGWLAWGGLAPGAWARRAAALAVGVAVLSLPVLLTGGLLPPTSSPLTDSAAHGNLIGPLEPAQAAGIWPAGDFRLDPVAGPLVFALIGFAVTASILGLALAWRGRAWGALAYVGGTLAAGALIWALGSPWVDGKALATASPAIPFAAMAGACGLIAAGRRSFGIAVAVALAGGVLWSNALAYRDVNLAPREQLSELERIGRLVAGEGPTLMTEYEPYGVRHFLRGGDAEGISELRRHQIPLRDGTLVAKGGSVDTDRIDLQALAYFRTLVLRRSPAQSRPLSPYELVWRGESYEVWQRPANAESLPASIPLGAAADPYSRPRCAAVKALARRGDLIAAAGPEPIAVALAKAEYPADWTVPGSPSTPIPRGRGTLTAQASVPRAGEYEVWLGGSVRPAVELEVDGATAGEVRHELNNAGQYVRLGSARLGAGPHQLELRFGGADLHPGSGGMAGAIGPLVLAAGDASRSRLIDVPAADAQRLCGRAWDWIELRE